VGRRLTGEHAVVPSAPEPQVQLEKFMVTSPAAFCTLYRSRDGWFKMPYASPRFEELWGIAPTELERDAAPLAAVIHADEQGRLVAALHRSATELRVLHEEFRSFHPETGEMWVEAHFTVERDTEGGVLWSGFLTDVTHRHRAEAVLLSDARSERHPAKPVTPAEDLDARIRHTAKLEAMGKLAAGVAHDFNNLLTVISVNADLLHSEVPGGHAGAFVREIRLAADRATTLTEQLLNFSRDEKAVVHPLDVNAAVRETARMLHRLVGVDVKLELDLNAADGCVQMVPGHLTQVLVNLAVNARDAMDRGGRLTIETQDVEMLARVAPHALSIPSRYIMLAVHDTGTGMPADVRARAFDPFFTTKEAGHGTGLGLATVKGIVTQAGGFIELRSEPGQGTRVEVYLPVATGS
jgi:PAS domain S-box-containing protein